ncbi:nitrate reductase molybdenum cofactor assembly chaperone [Parasphingorhabdus sp.]|uniref:nitrate reductase molybdenum cofactor assembly chaperone n=1 Tax=Parasphingorhabdus sp. TaxID=2709688 RepID=UPI003A915181
MSVTFRILSALLQYPTVDIQNAVPEMRKALFEDAMLNAAHIEALEPLLNRLATNDLIDVQQNYVELFDRGRVHSLHLFEHVHGESRDRGQAMVDLRERYLAAGLDPVSSELPDYLPQFLEYCSVLPREAALEQLAEPGLVLVALARRLEERGSDYATVLITLCDMAGIDRGIDVESAIKPADDPDDLEALDAAWEEEEVTFGAESAPHGQAECPKAAAMVSRFSPSLDAESIRSEKHG